MLPKWNSLRPDPASTKKGPTSGNVDTLTCTCSPFGPHHASGERRRWLPKVWRQWIHVCARGKKCDSVPLRGMEEAASPTGIVAESRFIFVRVRVLSF